MNPTWAEVNAAVLAVLADWSRPRRRDGRAVAPASAPRPDLDIHADRLLGVRAAGRLADRPEVRVLPGTVVTPLARDLLRARGVAVRVVEARELGSFRTPAQGEWGFAIEATRDPGTLLALRRGWLDGFVWREVGRSAAEAAAWVAGADGRGALIVADEASAATWRANRVPGVRAATVGDLDEVARAVRALGANVLVVEPSTRPLPLIRGMAEHFRRLGPPSAPAWLDTDDAEDPR